MASEQERFLTGAIEAWMGEPDAIPKLVTTNYRLHAEKYEAMADNARLQALLAERDAEIVRLVDAGQAYIDAYDAALKALPHDERAEERCHTERYNLRAALAARGEGEF